MPRALAIALALLLSAPATAADYHVAAPPTGSDANPGSAALPFATIQRAANIVNPGDNVIVHAGTYAGFNVGRSGTAALPITFRTAAGEGPVIINTRAPEPFNGSSPRARINIDTASHIILDGFEVVGVADQRTSKAGIRIVCPPGAGGGDFGHITLRHIYSHHHGQWGILTGHVHHITIEDSTFSDNAAEHGIYLSNSGDGHAVRRCTLRNNSANGLHINADASQGGDGVITGVTVEQNLIVNNGIGSTYINASGTTVNALGGGSGINCDGLRDSTIRNNVLLNNHASGISLYRIDGALGAANNTVVNNTIIQGSPANTAARWCLNIADASTGNVVFNNILLNYHPSRGSIIITADSLPGFTSDANIVMDRLDRDADGPSPTLTLAQWRAQTGQDLNSRAVPAAQWSALFADLAGGDVRLSPSSRAKDSGLAALAGRSAPATDFEGSARPIGPAFDIGAYEFGSTGSSACNPADLTDIGNSGAGPDAQLTVDDLIAFVNAFSDAAGCPGTAPCNVADITALGGSGAADGQLTVDDLIAFVNAFSEGC